MIDWGRFFDVLEPAVMGLALTFVLAACEKSTGWNVWWLFVPLWSIVALAMLLVYLSPR
jgi:hypothetical protein